MATFRVGQRVRVVRSDNYKYLIGDEGVIVPHDGTPGCSGRMFEYDVLLKKNGLCTANGDSLEPIQPERNQVIAWSECLWQPNRTEEHA